MSAGLPGVPPPGASPDGAEPLAAATVEPPAIRIRHLWHRYGGWDVLRDVNLEVPHGEIFGFIGPNGAGKTTTIRVMATLLEPLAGRVEIDGWDVTLDPERVRRVIGYMPDHAGVYDRISVREYLEFFAAAHRVPDPSVVDASIELTELGNLQDRLVAGLSKGMKQRLQLARILLHDPKVLILDEPASDLDPRARIEIRDLLLELRELGKTVFLSSHILTELSDVCTSVGILEKGHLVVAGPIGEIAERLAAQRAAQSGAAPVAAAVPVAFSAPRSVPPPPPETPDPAGTAPDQPPEQADATAPPLAAAPAFEQPAPPPPLAAAPTPAVTRGGAPIPAATRRKVKLRVLGDPRQVVPLLEGGAGVLLVEVSSAGHVLLHYHGDDRYLAEVVRYLVKCDVAIVGVEPERNELERIFLEVTRGDLQ